MVREYGAEDMRPEALRGQSLVLVVFWANWSAMCRKQTPIIARLSQACPNVTFAQLDMDVHRQVAEEYGIRAVPSMILFKDGVIVQRMEGLFTRATLERVIGEYM